MDKLYVKDLEVIAFHGVFPEEKKLGQKFLISMELSLNLRDAAITGDLEASVHYGELCHKIEEGFTRTSYDLIETAAEKMADFILRNYPMVEEAKVLLKKPWAPIHRSLDYAAVEVTRRWNKAFIALGSNMGDSKGNLDAAIELIEKNEYIEIEKKSSYIVTKPWGVEEQDDFLNAVIQVRTLMNPKELMRFLLATEKELKRERIIKWGPRTIDLDIIFFNDLVTTDEEVVLPHPRMHIREFVLEPLNEIAPYEIHPLYGKRVFEMLEELKK